MFSENCWDRSVFFWSVEVASPVPKLMKQATRPCLLFKDGKSFLKSTQTIVLSTTTGRAITPSSVQILVSFSRWPMCDVLMKWHLTLSLYLKEHWRGSRRTGKVILIFFCFFFTASIRSKKAPDNDYRAFQRDTTKTNSRNHVFRFTLTRWRKHPLCQVIKGNSILHQAWRLKIEAESLGGKPLPKIISAMICYQGS